MVLLLIWVGALRAPTTHPPTPLCPRLIRPSTALLSPAIASWQHQQRWYPGGRPTRKKPRRDWVRDLIPIKDRQQLEQPLPPDDPMRFLKIEAARVDGTLTAYRDPYIMRFTNIIMKWGKKDLARRLVEEALERIKRHQVKKWLEAPVEERSSIECNPRVIFKQAIQNARPLLQLRPVSKGGVTYQVPRDIRPDQAEFKAIQWFRDTCREKWIDTKTHFPENLATEILAAYNNEGRVVAMKREVHKTAEANRAYAHYR